MPKITEISAFIAEDTGPDDEGITASWAGPGQGWMPLVGADQARIASLRPLAQQLADSQGKPIKLVRFSVREVIEVIEPSIPGVQDPDPHVVLTVNRVCKECGRHVMVAQGDGETPDPQTCKEHLS